MIFIVLGFVFVVDQIYMVYFLRNSRLPVILFNSTLNKTVLVFITVPICVQPSTKIVLAQDLIFVLMRIILPFIIMVVCNVVLINHIRKSRNRVIRGRKEKKEHSFTMAVSFINGSFLALNIGVVVYYIILYYLRFAGISLNSVSNNIFSLYGTSAILVSYLFTLSQFFIDMIFNKVFRKEILVVFMILTGRQNQVEVTRGGNTQTQNRN